jgi:hypothetical protein
MRYIKVRWVHDFPDEPVLLYSEIDEKGWETRKVYLFRNGPAGFAGGGETSRSVFLGIEPIPSLDEIGRDPQFQPSEISRGEFEKVWGEAHSSQR